MVSGSRSTQRVPNGDLQHDGGATGVAGSMALGDLGDLGGAEFCSRPARSKASWFSRSKALRCCHVKWPPVPPVPSHSGKQPLRHEHESSSSSHAWSRSPSLPELRGDCGATGPPGLLQGYPVDSQTSCKSATKLSLTRDVEGRDTGIAPTGNIMPDQCLITWMGRQVKLAMLSKAEPKIAVPCVSRCVDAMVQWLQWCSGCSGAV